jgi:hypothetical protein
MWMCRSRTRGTPVEKDVKPHWLGTTPCCVRNPASPPRAKQFSNPRPAVEGPSVSVAIYRFDCYSLLCPRSCIVSNTTARESRKRSTHFARQVCSAAGRGRCIRVRGGGLGHDALSQMYQGKGGDWAMMLCRKCGEGVERKCADPRVMR